MTRRAFSTIVLVALVACSRGESPDPTRLELPRETASPHESPEAEASESSALRHVTVGRGDDVVLLLHGYGASGDDLVPVAEMLASRVHATFLVPEGPLAIGGGARAWFDPPRSQYRGRQRQALRQVEQARAQLLALLAESRMHVSQSDSSGATREERGSAAELNQRRVVVAGFSQGAMMAIDLALHDDRELAAVVALSGAELPTWSGRYASRRALPVFLSHGRNDAVIPFADAEHLRTALTDAGVHVTWQPFDGGHELAPVVGALTRFLRETFEE